MLYQAIRAGSEQYRSDPSLNCSNKAYRKLLCCDMDHSKWRDPPTLDRDEVGKVRDFVARTWKTRNMQAKSEHLLPALKKVLPKLNKLRGKTILDVCLDESIDGKSIADVICSSFKGIANCGPPSKRNGRPNNEVTAASKILHIVNPELFVMWDERHHRWVWWIQGEARPVRGLPAKNAKACQLRHLPKVRPSAAYTRERQSRRLKCDGHTIAKALDEYNYVKFTLNDDSVWQTEYESCSSP